MTQFLCTSDKISGLSLTGALYQMTWKVGSKRLEELAGTGTQLGAGFAHLMRIMPGKKDSLQGNLSAEKRNRPISVWHVCVACLCLDMSVQNAEEVDGMGSSHRLILDLTPL